jgi:hypothetical protein
MPASGQNRKSWVVRIMSATPPQKRTCKRKATERVDQAQSVRFEPRCSRASERDSNPKTPALQVVALALDFRNYTKMTKYEALEKNAVSEPKMPPLGNLKYSRNSRKASLCWEIFGLFIDGEIRWRV